MTPFRLCTALLASFGALALAACQEATAPPAAPGVEAEEIVAEAEPAQSDVKLPQMVCGADAFIGPDATRDSLIANFGGENLVEEAVSWVDSVETALVMYPADPAVRVEMFWFDKTSGGPRHVRVEGAESQWIGPGGLFVGASLADIEAANGGPFELMGFENHNSGEVVDWLGGALAAKPDETCEFGMVLTIPSGLADGVAAAVSGDPEKVYRSDSPEMRAANPSAYGLALQYFDPS